MDGATRETRRAGVWTLALCAVLVGLWALVACAPDARADAPDDLSVAVQQATDSTVVVTARWSGKADVWLWRVVDGASGEVDSLSVSAEVARADTATQREVCVAGVNERNGQRGNPGPEACAGFSVPPTPISTPDAPSIDTVEVDSTIALALDSSEVYPSEVTLAVGDTAQLTFVGWEGGEVTLCSGACDTVPGFGSESLRVASDFRNAARLAMGGGW